MIKVWSFSGHWSFINVFVNGNGGECQNTVSKDTDQCLRTLNINNVTNNEDNIILIGG
jgi:hypothetical protein